MEQNIEHRLTEVEQRSKTGESIPVGNAEIDEAELTAALEEVLS